MQPRCVRPRSPRRQNYNRLVVTVETLPGKKSAQIGALSPKSLARILLRELATEGLEPLCDFVHQRIVICLPIRPKCDCGHRFSFSSSLILAIDIRSGPGGGHGKETR